MTVPRLSVRGPRGREYPWPPEEPAIHVPSITRILSEHHRPALVPWAARTVAEAAVKMTKTGALGALVEQSDAQAVDALKNVHAHNRDSAANIGDEVHKALEATMTGRDLPELSPTAREAWGHLERLLDELDVQPRHAEATVYGDTGKADAPTPEKGYGGTLDLVADVTLPGRSEPTRLVIDLKTHAKGGPYESAAWQVSAARYATHIVTDLGDVIPMPETSGGLILVARMSEAIAVPVDAGENAFAAFAACRDLYRLSDKTLRYVRSPISTGGAS